MLLAFLLIHVEIGKADQGAEHIEGADHDHNAVISVHAVNDYGRKHTEADQVTEGIDLDTETFFLYCAFLRGSNCTVEHIAEAGDHQADHRVGNIIADGMDNAQEAEKHANIGQYDCIIVITE